MLQTVDGREVFVVDFDTVPQPPITWATEEEKPYALALDSAIREKLVTEPGKYGIHVTNEVDRIIYNIFHINE